MAKKETRPHPISIIREASKGISEGQKEQARMKERLEEMQRWGTARKSPVRE